MAEPIDERLLRELEEELGGSPCPPCLKCGWCCKHTVCYYGKWDYDRAQCMYLTEQNLCAKYDEIVSYEKSIGIEPGLFGSGCCLNYMNPERLSKLVEKRGQTRGEQGKWV